MAFCPGARSIGLSSATTATALCANSPAPSTGEAHGFREPVRVSTLADANETRDCRIYAEFAQRVIGPVQTPLRRATMARQRCRPYGGLSPGAPIGVRNGNWRHGHFSKEAQAHRRHVAATVSVEVQAVPRTTSMGDRDELRDMRKLRQLITGLYVFETERVAHSASHDNELAVFADLAVHSEAAAMCLRDNVVGDRDRPSPVPSPVGLVVKNG
jgi:hypothetical protein